MSMTHFATWILWSNQIGSLHQRCVLWTIPICYHTMRVTASLHGCHLKSACQFLLAWHYISHQSESNLGIVCLFFVCFTPPSLSPSTSRPSAANKMSWITTSLRATRTPCPKRDGGIAFLLTVNVQWPKRAAPTTPRWESILCWRKFGLQKHWNSVNLSKNVLNAF